MKIFPFSLNNIFVEARRKKKKRKCQQLDASLPFNDLLNKKFNNALQNELVLSATTEWRKDGK